MTPKALSDMNQCDAAREKCFLQYVLNARLIYFLGTIIIVIDRRDDIMKFTTLLIDADDTIFDFSKCEYEALRLTLERGGYCFDDELHRRFSKINIGLWKQFEMNKITRAELRVERFKKLLEMCFAGCVDNPRRYPILAEKFVDNLSRQSALIDGAREALQKLSRVYDIHIITNGLKKVQYGRMEKAELEGCYNKLFVSEEIGIQKPDKAFFEYVFDRINEKDHSKILVVGDSLTSDMQGGKNAGLCTCIYDPKGKITMPHPLCDYRIEKLGELLDF